MAEKSMLERYEESKLKEKGANKQSVDFFQNTHANGYKANAKQGDESQFKDAEIQKRTAKTSVKYTDTTRN